ncbi:hypothetical protein BDN67DRAFT_917641, partial [Paxillus ammoniavirescens]
FVSLKCGIIVHINIDWFQSLKRANYSSGTLWLTIDNLLQSIHYLQENTFLLLVIPGPTEPNTDQLNGLLELSVKELESISEDQLQISYLYKLINIVAKIEDELFDVFGHEAKEEVHVALSFAPMDTPAHLKSAEFLSQNSDDFMCPEHKAPF